MTSFASDKRWAIVPPPPATPEDEVGSEVGSEVGVESSIRMKRERPTRPGPANREEFAVSQVRELDPENPRSQSGTESERDRITEVPDTIRNRLSDPDFETIPAPPWVDVDD